MLIKLAGKKLKSLNKHRSRFGQEKSGVAAVEFALIAPLMILLFMGTMEVSMAVTVDRKLSRVASRVSDLVAQSEDDLTLEEIQDILRVTQYIMMPYDVKPHIEVLGISTPGSEGGSSSVAWSCAVNGSAATVGTVVKVPDDIAKASEFLIQTIVRYDYQPVAGWAGFTKKEGLTVNWASLELAESLYAKPRTGTSVTLTGSCPEDNPAPPVAS